MQPAALLTRHGKGAAIAAALAGDGHGVITISDWDTDQLGSFCGATKRPLPATTVVRLKAMLASDLSGLGRGLGSEGSFAGGPMPGLLSWHQELVCLYDRSSGQTVTGVSAGPAPLTPQTLAGREELQALVQRYPGQGWLLRNDAVLHKGLLSVAQILHHAPDWPVTLEPDWRAMLSPMRRQRIYAAAQNLAERLRQLCPACRRPDFWPDDVRPGLPCADCATPTSRILSRTARCLCGFSQTTVVSTVADPYDCPRCNP